jgi:hypothetical protein
LSDSLVRTVSIKFLSVVAKTLQNIGCTQVPSTHNHWPWHAGRIIISNHVNDKRSDVKMKPLVSGLWGDRRRMDLRVLRRILPIYMLGQRSTCRVPDGLDPTSGLCTGEGHIPLACTPDPLGAASVDGNLSTSRGLVQSPHRSSRYCKIAKVSVRISLT